MSENMDNHMFGFSNGVTTEQGAYQPPGLRSFCGSDIYNTSTVGYSQTLPTSSSGQEVSYEEYKYTLPSSSSGLQQQLFDQDQKESLRFTQQHFVNFQMPADGSQSQGYHQYHQQAPYQPTHVSFDNWIHCQVRPAARLQSQALYRTTSIPSSLGRSSLQDVKYEYPVPDMRQSPIKDNIIYHGEPYAQLLLKALRQAPGYRMVLQDIYRWFEKHTDKAADPKSKGWQNSIRHNLSMNHAFVQMEMHDEDEGKRRAHVWTLSEHSRTTNRVAPTTRYRKAATKKSLPYSTSAGVKKTSISRTMSPYVGSIQSFQRMIESGAINVINVKKESEEVDMAGNLSQPMQQDWSSQQDDLTPSPPFPPSAQELPSQHVYQHDTPVPYHGYHYPQKMSACESFSSNGLHYLTPHTGNSQQQASPTPSMTSANSSTGYQEVNDQGVYSPRMGNTYPGDQQYFTTGYKQLTIGQKSPVFTRDYAFRSVEYRH